MLQQSGMGASTADAVETPTRKPKSKKAKEADYNADSPGFLDDSDDAEHKGDFGRGTGKTKRNPKQQAQNKQAQQRWAACTCLQAPHDFPLLLQSNSEATVDCCLSQCNNKTAFGGI